VAKNADAGMPSAQLILTELGKRRMEELSFFLVGFLLVAAVVRWLWNYVQAGVPNWPRLTYPRTVAFLLVWGLAMTVVLTLISGARELMTPAAWEPNGITHRLSSREDSKAATTDIPQRHAKLDVLRKALWKYSETHDGRFPVGDRVASIPEETWLVQSNGVLRYVYVPGLSTEASEAILVYEPEIYEGGQLVLLTSGRIAKLADVSEIASK
jgi:hypothetical protein